MHAVVDPAAAEDAVLGGADQAGLCPGAGTRPVRERYLVGRDGIPRAVGDGHELDPDLPRGIVEPEPADPGQLGRRPGRPVPGLGGQPARQQLQLGGNERGLVNDGHAVQRSFLLISRTPTARTRSWPGRWPGRPISLCAAVGAKR